MRMSGWEPGNRSLTDIVAAGDLAHPLAVLVAAADGLALLVFGQFRFAAELVRRSIAASGPSGRDAAAVISMRW
jgi:hypothetical protein